MIDLYSDTKTRPTRGMRRAIAEAVVGDEQHGEDPTVTALNERVAKLLGKPAAVFLPSGTMANEIALLVHCRPGDEVLTHEQSHLLNFEGGAPSALGGVMVRGLRGARGMFDETTLRAGLRRRTRIQPRSRLVCFEQTTNLGGGAVWSLAQMEALATLAHEAGLRTHMDGARLWNAVVAAGIAAERYASAFDTVFVDFTKGLGAPFGAVLAGSEVHIEEAWIWKQRLGGAMRQAGLMAAACTYALDHHLDRLRFDHENARRLAVLLRQVKGLRVDEPETNMVYCDVTQLGISAAQFDERLQAHDIRMSTQSLTRLRAVTHLDVTAADIEKAGRVVQGIVASM